jgi:hypothetical protein
MNIKQIILEEIEKVIINEPMYFNNGRFKKEGLNVIYKDDEPVAEFYVMDIGNYQFGDNEFQKAIVIDDTTLEIDNTKIKPEEVFKFIFTKLPKIKHVITQCYMKECSKLKKIGGDVVYEIESGNGAKILVIDFKREKFV